MKQPKDMLVIFVIDIFDEDDLVASIEERLIIEALVEVFVNFEGDDIMIMIRWQAQLRVGVHTIIHQRS